MCHILVIEDDFFIADYIVEVAVRAGATSTSVASQEDEAVEIAEGCPPDLIVSDVALLEGTGPAAVQRIRQCLGDIPTIFVTATPDACVPCEYARAILQKPVSSMRLSQEIKRVSGSC